MSMNSNQDNKIIELSSNDFDKVKPILDNLKINILSMSQNNTLLNDNLSNDILSDTNSDISLSGSDNSLLDKKITNADELLEYKTKIINNIQPICNGNETKVKKLIDIYQNNKIILDVGGTEFLLEEKFLKILNINLDSLITYQNENNEQCYFLDKDPYYFEIILSIINESIDDNNLLTNKIIMQNILNYSNNLISEICNYGIIDKKICPPPKIKLINNSNHQKNEIIEIYIGDKYFKTTSDTILHSGYFKKKIIKNKINKLISQGDPNIFNHVLFLLRNKELFIFDEFIKGILNFYEIKYQDVSNNNNMILNVIGSYYGEIKRQTSTLIPKINFHFTTPNDRINFGDIAYFDIINEHIFTGNLLDDILLCIDVPVLDTYKKTKYCKNFQYKIIEKIEIIIYSRDSNEEDILFEKKGIQLYLNNYINDTKNLSLNIGEKIKLLYNDVLIDVQRYIIPLYLFIGKKCYLPLDKLVKNKKYVQCRIKIATLNNLIEGEIIDIPLLNMSLIGRYRNKNYIKYQDEDDNKKIYIYTIQHFISFPVIVTDHPIYNTVQICLSEYNKIKDFFIIIIDKNEYDKNNSYYYLDALVELNIIYSHSPHKDLISKLDSYLLKIYEPVTILGQIMPAGIYYHNLNIEELSGNLYLDIKVQKIEGYIFLLLNEKLYKFF